MDYGKIAKPFWDDKPVAIVGGGPSLVGFDFEQLRGAHVLAVKRSIFAIPWADAGFGLGEWQDKLTNVTGRVYWAVPEDQLLPAPAKNVTFLRRLSGQDVSADPSCVYGGGTSGFASMQVGIHKRAKRIILFGFDYVSTITGANPGEPSTQFQRRREQTEGNWRKWAEHFRVYVTPLREHGISVVNACPQSQIGCFQKVTLDDGVNMLH